MSITFSKAYVVAGKPYATLCEAKVAAIQKLFPEFANNDGIAELIVKHSDSVVNILTTKENSHPAARKANGATRKPRKNRITEPATTTAA